MDVNSNIELERQHLQDLLDSQKTQEERKSLGQFPTPKTLADSIVRAALVYINKNIRFLDTSIGTGVFFSSLLDNLEKKNIVYACGYEIDAHYAFPSKKLWQNEKIDYTVGDFLNFMPPQKNEEKFNMIISNPPYVRHHYIEKNAKKELNECIRKAFDLSFSGLTGLYGYFMALSARWLQKDGISVWLVPNEFLDVNYGIMIKTFLLSKVKLLRIHRFNPLKLQFSDALVSSTVLFYTTGHSSDTVLFSTGNDINKPDVQKYIFHKNLNPNDKWSNYFSSQTKTNKCKVSLGDYFVVKRGIATGSNKHFILTEEAIEKLDIPDNYLLPILPSPRYVKGNVIENGLNGYINGTKKRYLLNVTCSESDLYNLPKNLILYLNNIYNEVKDNYTIRTRSPWYKQEYRPECPFLMSYMGRKQNEPFRLFLNKTNATVPNVYLMLYPKFNWHKAEAQNSGFLENLHNRLQSIDSETLVSSGRVYGGGLYKLEPKELMSVPIDDILSNDLISVIYKTTNTNSQLLLFQ
ncbi:MAG: Eco57I restriction-modification methylase domain-containing protein [Treponema sp.]|nr:Eco57I restriction-modification methylase domain-containing protein [Treponema sp.]